MSIQVFAILTQLAGISEREFLRFLCVFASSREKPAHESSNRRSLAKTQRHKGKRKEKVPPSAATLKWHACKLCDKCTKISAMEVRVIGNLCLVFLLFAFLPMTAAAQQTVKPRIIPFRIAADDPAAKLSFTKWSVMGKFEGEVTVTETSSSYVLRIDLHKGELLAPKSSKKILTVTPFLAKRHKKTFDFAAKSSTAMLLDTVIQQGETFALKPHQFLIEVSKEKQLSEYWLAFEIAVACEYPSCTMYAHSSGNIFAR